jgi:hypothetical protein
MRKLFLVLLLVGATGFSLQAQSAYSASDPYKLYFSMGFDLSITPVSQIDDYSSFPYSFDVMYRLNSDWRINLTYLKSGLMEEFFYGDYSNLRIGASTPPFRQRVKSKKVYPTITHSAGYIKIMDEKEMIEKRVSSTLHGRFGYQRETVFIPDGTKGNNFYIGIENRRVFSKYDNSYNLYSGGRYLNRQTKETLFYLDLAYMPYFNDEIEFDEYVPGVLQDGSDITVDTKNLGYRFGAEFKVIGSRTINQAIGFQIGRRPQFFNTNGRDIGPHTYFKLTWKFIIAK